LFFLSPLVAEFLLGTWFPEKPVMAASHTVDLVGNEVFSLLAVGLLVGARISREKLGDS